MTDKYLKRELYYSKVEPDKLLHIVNRGNVVYNPEKEPRHDLVPEDQFIQCSILRLTEGQTFRPHKHIWKPGEGQVIAQESWVILHGSVRATFYDLDDTILAEPILYAWDASFTLEGGHTYTILEDGTSVYEYKTGPYKGQSLDKEFLGEA